MLKHIFSLIIVLGFATASLFDGLQDAKHGAKNNFNKGLDSSPQLNLALDLPQDKVSNSIDYFIKQELKNKFEETLDNIVEYLIQLGNESFRSINEVKLLVNQIYKKLKDLSSESSDILFNGSESGEQNNDRVEEFFQSLRVEIVGYSKYEFENIYGFENIVKPIKDKAYNVTEQIKNKFNELGQIGQKLNNFMQLYESSEEQLLLKKVLANLGDELIDNLDVDAVVKLFNELNDPNHPLIDVLVETVEHRVVIMNELLKKTVTENYFTGDDVVKSIKKVACDLLDMISKNDNKEKLSQFIQKEAPENMKNKLRLALDSGDVNGLSYVVKPICKASTYLMALVFFELTDTLFPVNNASDYELQERIFLFIEWLKFVVQNAFQYSDKKIDNLHDSAQELMKKLKEHNEQTLIDAMHSLEPFKKEFQGLFQDIEKEIKKALNS